MKKLHIITLATLALLLSSCTDGNIEPSIYQWLTFLLPPVTGVIGWFSSRYTRKADTIQKMQESIDLLLEKNAELYQQVTKLREENAELRKSNIELKTGQRKLQQEFAKLKK